MTPALFNPQDSVFENEAERHLSHWTPKDFRNYPDVQNAYVHGKLLVVISKMHKSFSFENPYRLKGAIYQFLAAIQRKVIAKRGIHGYNSGLIMSLFNLLKKYHYAKH